MCEVCSVFYCSADADFYHCCLRMCLDCLGFYAIVRTWYVTIDCFASFPRDISANRRENGYSFLSYMYRYAVKQKARQIPTRCFADVRQQPQPAARRLGLGLRLLITPRPRRWIKQKMNCECSCCSTALKCQKVTKPYEYWSADWSLCGDELCSGLACSPELLRIIIQ